MQVWKANITSVHMASGALQVTMEKHPSAASSKGGDGGHNAETAKSSDVQFLHTPDIGHTLALNLEPAAIGIVKHRRAVYIVYVIAALIQLPLLLGAMLFTLVRPRRVWGSEYPLPFTNHRLSPGTEFVYPLLLREWVAGKWLLVSACLLAPLALLFFLSIGMLYIGWLGVRRGNAEVQGKV